MPIVCARIAKSVAAREAKRSRDHVGMTVEIFGRRMHHDVGAQRDRLGEDRRRAGRSRPRAPRPPRRRCAPPLRCRSRPRADCSASRARRGLSLPASPPPPAPTNPPRRRTRRLLRGRAPRCRAKRGAPNTCPWPRPRGRPVRTQKERDRRRHARSVDQGRGRALERPDHRLGLAHRLVVGTAIDIAAAINTCRGRARTSWRGGSAARWRGCSRRSAPAPGRREART